VGLPGRLDEPRLVCQKGFPTGLQSLYRSGGHGVPEVWAVRLQNRTNDTWVIIPKEKVPIWREMLS
jgi:hypothetical protein